jgi:predicted GIY-YIG superfamily endonuclease
MRTKNKYCIYFLIYKKKVVYVGYSKSFSGRIKGHSSKKFDATKVINCRSKKEALSYEKRWIKRFNPVYNTVGVRRSKDQFIAVPARKMGRDVVLLKFTVSKQLYDNAEKMALLHGRPIENYLSWCILRGVTNDAAMISKYRYQSMKADIPINVLMEQALNEKEF